MWHCIENSWPLFCLTYNEISLPILCWGEIMCITTILSFSRGIFLDVLGNGPAARPAAVSVKWRNRASERQCERRLSGRARAPERYYAWKTLPRAIATTTTTMATTIAISQLSERTIKERQWVKTCTFVKGKRVTRLREIGPTQSRTALASLNE